MFNEECDLKTTSLSKYIEKIEFNNFEEFFKEVIRSGEYNSSYVFRGLSTSEHKLIPRALRGGKEGCKIPTTGNANNTIGQVADEEQYLLEFYRMANDNGLKVPYIQRIKGRYNPDFVCFGENKKWPTEDYAELAALAQHYGGCTRLLDWTQDIFVSLYFAVEGAIKAGLKKIEKLKIALKNGFTEDVKKHYDEVKKWEVDNLIIWAINILEIERSSNFKSEDEEEIPLKFVRPSYYENPNLNAQKGVLSYWKIPVDRSPIDRTSLDELVRNYFEKINHENVFGDELPLMYRFEIPLLECRKIYDELGKFNYSLARLFPGYKGVTSNIEEIQMINEFDIMREWFKGFRIQYDKLRL